MKGAAAAAQEPSTYPGSKGALKKRKEGKAAIDPPALKPEVPWNEKPGGSPPPPHKYPAVAQEYISKWVKAHVQRQRERLTVENKLTDQSKRCLQLPRHLMALVNPPDDV